MHMWSSEKARGLNQEEARAAVGRPIPVQHWGLIGGREVPYEFASDDKDGHGSAFDDLKYLGEGSWLRNERMR